MKTLILAALAALTVARLGAGLAEQADPHRRALPAGRLVGHHRARHLRSRCPRR